MLTSWPLRRNSAPHSTASNEPATCPRYASGHIYHNGTLSFVDTGTEKLAITADHVYAAYLKDLDAGRVFECQFGGVLVRPETMVIARDPHLDIATFRMPSVAMSRNADFQRSGQGRPDRP